MAAKSSNNEVFVSFKRDDDTHKIFIDPLCTALVQAGLSPLISDKQAILESRICIVVLSKNYASSVYCLDELVTILEYRKIGGTVLPVFCDVDPSEFRRQTGSIGEAFTLYIEKVIDKETDFPRREGLIQNLKAVLTEVADMAGFVLPNGPDSDGPRLIRSVVDFIRYEIKSNKFSSWGNNVCDLMDSGLSKLPNDMVFPVLKELFLQDNKYILAIPPSFFHFMPSLKVLDMSRTSIKKLPSSISKLVKLQKLFLRDCKLLMELPPEIQDLKNLRLFDLSGTELIYIPVTIKHLLKLKCLRMSLCASADEYISEINESIEIEKRIEIIPKNTLRKLLNLQELSIFVDLNCKWWGAIAESIVLDLVKLKKLQILKLYFPTVHILQRLLEHHVVCESLSDFKFIVGHEEQHVISRFFSQELQDEFEMLRKCLKYVNGTEDINEVANACKYARTLFLDRHWSIERLSVLKNSCENIRFCVLVECNKMKNVIDGHDLFPEDNNEDMGNAGKPAILLLQYLSIHYMKNLTSIWVGPFPSGSLNNLQILALSTCPNVNTIFDDRLLCNLLNLKELIVEDCPKVESLVSVESSYLKYDKVFLPCLEKITLLFLPELVSISRGLEIAPRLVTMVVYDCPKLLTLSPMEVCSKNIKEIKGDNKWWEALDRSNDQLDVFVPLGGDGLMNQLSDARISRNTLSIIQASHENEVVAKAKNMQVLSKNLIKKVGDIIVIGFESHLQYMKSMLLEDARTVVVISAPGGYGKTILARMIRKDDDIRGMYGEIFFVCVSDEPFLKAIIENIFRQKGRTPPKFESDEDAIIQLESLMIEICPDRVLLILDDVLPEWEPLIQKLIFIIPGYRILITTRCTFRQFDFYRLPKLNSKDATTLFCHSAFPQAMRYDIPSFLLNKIVGCCNGIPLVLVVVGRCLCEQPEAVWVLVLERLSERDVSIDHLESCINVLGFLGENSIIKEHYLDLGSFPKNKPIQASALMDIWMESYKLDEMTTSDNYKPLLELLSRNLVKRGPMSQLLCGNDLKLELGLAREFGIGQSTKEPVELLRRLILDIRGNELPKWWTEKTHKFLSARLLSITTDGTFSSNWFEIQLPEVEVMILTFSSSSYSLPDFMKGMDELKALIISNHSYHSVELNNIQQVRHLCNLRRITLRNILLPSLGEILVQMTNLQKVTLLMCKMTEATEIGTEKIQNFPPNLEEISIEHCDDMLKIPAGLCSIIHLKKLDILYCYELVELPDEIGSLTKLESLNLSGCGRLKMLPESIGDLKKLEVLDISHCLDMKLLPSRLGELDSLIKLSIQGCYGLYDLPPSFKDLAQLKNVVCSEDIFHFIKDVHPSAIIEVHKEPIDLDWLHII